MSGYDHHYSVMLDEALKALFVRKSGTYADCTYGRGGHSRRILSALGEKGRLLALDSDLDAVSHAKKMFANDSRVIVEHSTFSNIKKLAEKHNATGFDGVLLDLGVSSPQLDNAKRGFSFRLDGPLDMRLNSSAGITAADWLQEAPQKEIEEVLKNFGEERYFRRIARALVTEREKSEFKTTSSLVEIVKKAMPALDKNKHPATRVFQAIRIHINRELDELSHCLEQLISLMNAGGRIVVISFHSLEDRIVKNFFKRKAQGEYFPRKFPIKDADIKRTLRVLGKPLKASPQEILNNRRSRSATMRVAEKMP